MLRVYYVIPLKKSILPMDIATLEDLLPLTQAVTRLQLRFTNITNTEDHAHALPVGKFYNGHNWVSDYHAGIDIPTDVLATSAFPSFDEGKFFVDGKRHVGRGIIMGTLISSHNGVIDFNYMIGPGATLDYYKSVITF